MKILVVALLGLLVPSGFAHVARQTRAEGGTEAAASFQDHYTNTRFIDLSHAFNNDTAVWPGRKITFFTEFESRNKFGVWSASHGFCTSEHTSTHIDAPYHFNENGRRLNEIPFEDLIDVPAVKIDIYDKVHRFKNGRLIIDENYALTREDVIEWEKIHGRIPERSVVLLRTGWDTRWGDSKAFRGEKTAPSSPPTEEDLLDRTEDNELIPASGGTSENKQFYDPSEAHLSTELSFPAYHESAARFLAEERSVRGVGVDVISIDPGNQNVLSPAHVTFASRNIYMLEMVANMHQLPPKGFNLWMVPFKIDRGTGAPTRVIARINDQQNH